MVAQKRKGVGNTEHPPTLLGGTAIKPPERHGWERIGYLIYNPEKGEIFTRTPSSWALIFIFYCIYYSCLAAFWYGMLMIFFQFMPTDQPKYILSSSIIGVNPGVGMLPGQPKEKIDSSMLFLKADAKDEDGSSGNFGFALRYQQQLDRYGNTSNTKICQGDDFNKEKSEACNFDPMQVLGDCAKFPYGYQLEEGKSRVEPCVLLRINRIYGWKPEEYTDQDLDDEEKMPESVKDLIRADKKNLYLDCQGENPADVEALEGNLQYFPSNQAIPFKYFPYTQAHNNYHKPLVAVKFKNLPYGQLLHIECKLWTKGVIHSSKHRTGQVHFEIILY